jgi:SpoVK/Ycf46/Vps4 family AAA+-type ATPase
VHAKGKPISREGNDIWESDALLHKVAEVTIGYAGADLANLLNEASILMVCTSLSNNSCLQIHICTAIYYLLDRGTEDLW